MEPKAPENNPLETVSQALGAGKLVYLPRIVLESVPYAVSYIVMHNLPGTVGISPPVCSYRLGGGQNYFDPRFAPSGKYLVFHEGDLFDRYGTDHIFVWRFGAGQVDEIPDDISLPLTLISPDSSKLCYIVGGDRTGSEYDQTGQDFNPLKLTVYDLKTRLSHKVAQGPAVGQCAWTKQNDLLYTDFSRVKLLPDAASAPAKAGGKTKARPQRWVYSIFEADHTGGPAKLLVASAYAPSPSPDNKWIAFQGWAPAKPAEAAVESAQPLARVRPNTIFVYDRATGRQRLLRRLRSATAIPSANPIDVALRWTPDSKQLLIMESTYAKVEADRGRDTMTLEAIELAGGGDPPAARKVAQLQANDFLWVPRGDLDSQFDPMQVSHDGQSIVVKVSEYIGHDHGFYTERKSMQSIRLSDGQTTLLAQLLNKWGNVVGWDWLDLSQPAPVSAGSASRP